MEKQEISPQVQELVNEAMSEINRGCVEFIGAEYIQSLVTRFYTNGKTFIVKAGFDPTAPDLHLGHSVLLRKLATFQKYGGVIKFLIGDFTATIGDPSGKSQTRKALTFEEVEKNAETYKEQVFKILDPKNTDICFNKEWLGKLNSVDMLRLTSFYSVARMMERDDFTKRFKENSPISIVEFMYPLLQGYDSVALNCDIELGGNDQKFNLLVGRALQRSYECGKEQSVMTMPLLEGLDGVNKMSKSLNNYIGLTDNANDMYGKVLSIDDSLMWRYFELISSKSLKEIESMRRDVESGALHPKKAKEILALDIVSSLHDLNAAHAAQEHFNNVFSKKEIPNDIPTFHFELGEWICKALLESKLTPSTSQARRDIKAGALSINNEKILDENYKFSQKGEYIIKLGKRKFARIII
ncbi:tyrosine--tRNA ligase [Helicobacter saguini]|uniref:Tyrosine--tRNA ligase n=1 Tax=Helicobacter saguini TaxID=1548018 RepID=A0A347VM51_9HELI|nr:tyrosine--tRNA ligase [Helicobacter saguini]MWV61926.1 tyrosine--tRNA ligase [Helicobacter saguini]MWV67399.1 tyrosine--tRNA ligase [Helicobacter saguini]MWV69752.1 tyrosine--tRNA ligase [Helicobacter saguini]MWV73031.1 tyrosine--tRNA ligase [Helicobacter saguini]TLD95593.1 tyrosine--tRNA ligase [Helicobacter saguini]